MRFDIDGGGGFDGGGYYELPYVAPPPAPAVPQSGGFANPDPIQDAFYGLPVGPSVSRVGPTVSVQPRAALDPNMRAGSLFSGGFPTQASFRVGRSPSFQRGFTVDIQERLQRRRKKFWER
jgi:hypothetical protein